MDYCVLIMFTLQHFLFQVKTSRGCCRLEKKASMGYAETCKSAFMNGPKCVRPLANVAR